jgi:hypothetical protein
VWTGDELVVWGGTNADGCLGNGAAYRPTDNTWRTLAAAPISPRADFASVWTGEELIVWSGYTTRHNGSIVEDQIDGAAYNPYRNSWRLLPKADIAPRSAAFAARDAASERMVIWGGTYPQGGFARDGVVYDPKRNQFKALPPAPATFEARRPEGILAGPQVALLGGRCSDNCANGVTLLPSTLDWQTLAPPPIKDFAQWSAYQGVQCRAPHNHGFFFGGERAKSTAVFGAQYTYTKGWSPIAPPEDSKAPSASYSAFCHQGSLGIVTGIVLPLTSPPVYPDVFAIFRNTKWEVLPKPGLTPRIRPYVVPFGSEVFVWGGELPFGSGYPADGKVYKFGM